jgi:uncharacterized phage protein gp47/JayE
MGTELWGIPFSLGTPAASELTITMVDNAGYTVPAGAEFDVDGVAFATVSAATVAPGSTSVSNVPIQATEVGTQGNDLVGDTVALLFPYSFVASATLEATTAGGTDSEEIDAYRTRLVTELMLRGVTLVTLRDYELLALTQPTIGRVLAIQSVVDRQIEVYVAQADGTDVSAPVKSALGVLYEALHQTNWTVVVADPNRTAVSVTVVVVSYPGVDTADLDARVTAALTEWLSPGKWGRPKSGEQPSTAWLDEPIIRKNKLIDLVGDVTGVDYVDTLTITGAAGSGNLTLTGPAALPTPGTIDVTVTAP